MTLLLALLIAFPGERIANLPTGRTLDAGVWQIGIGHRWMSAADNSVLEGNFLNIIRDASVRISVERGFDADVNAGAWVASENNEVGVGASWAPARWLTASAGVGGSIVALEAARTWANAGAAFHAGWRDRIHFTAMPRFTTNLDGERMYATVGLGLKGNLGRGFTLGFETEPVLYRSAQTDDTGLLAWNVAIDRKLGWHNFTVTVGNAWHQAVPGWFASANRDITRGHFRIGFAILRKL